MKVWVTRDEKSNGPLSTALRQAGLEAICEPVITRCPASHWDNDHVDSLAETDLLVLTSVYAIELLASLTQHRATGVAVVGEASRKAALAAGFRVVHVAGERNAQSLFVDLRKKISAGRVCYPRSAQAQEQSSWAGVAVVCPVLYDTTARNFDRSVMDRAQIVAVASPSAVRAIGSIDLPFASIGPTTSRALDRTPAVEAPQRSFESLATAIAAYASDSRHQRA